MTWSVESPILISWVPNLIYGEEGFEDSDENNQSEKTKDND